MFCMKTLYAHSGRSETDLSTWQTLEAHAQGVAALAEGFAKAFSSGETAALLGRIHDLGKQKAAFQEHLRDSKVRCTHAYDGAKWLEGHVAGGFGRLLAYAVAGHHTGLPDGVANVTGLNAHLAETPMPELPEGFTVELPELQALIPPFLRSREGDPLRWHLWVRMLFSALVDADWLDTEAFMSPERATLRPTRFDDMATLWGKFERAKAAFAARERTPLNVLRAEILEEALAAAERPQGLFSLTVPTGGGKTFTSLGFALRHACRHGLRKVFYVVPFSTIIEQTSDVLGEVLGRENVLEHHAEARWREKDDKDTTALQLATENWAGFPVVTTTNVQFFESFYAAHTSRCRKLHNVANSVIILDEAHAVPQHVVAPCANLLRRLCADYGCTVVLCTATQPDFEGFKLSGASEIVRDPRQLYEALRRVDYDSLGKVETWTALAEHMAGQPSALSVLNLRKDACALFRALRPRVPEGACFHLSTWMCPQHRREHIAAIRERLREGKPTFVVSTSLIEAGVDLDFPVAYRAKAGLPSIAQTGGRCNREGKLERGKVFVFEAPEPIHQDNLRKDAEATDEFENLEEALHNPETYKQFSRLRQAKSNKDGSEMLECLRNPTELQFQEVEKAFRLIEERPEVTVFVPYKEAKTALDEAMAHGVDWKSLRSLRRVAVQVSLRQKAQLETKGMLVPLRMYDGTVIPDHFALATLAGAYDGHTGLDAEAELPPVGALIQ